MDTCKIKAEESASKSNSIQVSNLLKSDSLDGRDGEDQNSQSPRGGASMTVDGFEIVEKEDSPDQ